MIVGWDLILKERNSYFKLDFVIIINMKHTNKISLKQIDKSKFSTIDTNKTQMFVPTMLNPIRQKSSTKSKEILKKIYSNDKIVYPSKKRESRYERVISK